MEPAEYQKIAKAMARKFAARHNATQMADDMEAYALAEIVAASHKYTLTPRLVGYITRLSIAKLWMRRHHVTLKKTQLYEHRRRNTQPATIYCDSFPEDYDMPDTQVSANTDTETLEAIYAVCENDTERDIVNLRASGLRDNGIGERMGCSQQHVSRKRRQLYDRYRASFALC